MWRCPLCKSPVNITNQPVTCENNHSFDKAKSGYVNLHPVQFKKSKHPGDDKAMVLARRAFHEAGSYLPLMKAMVSSLDDALPKDHKAIQLYDAGCGEGAYLAHCYDSLTALGRKVEASGSDISKVAVDLAAKKYKSLNFAVASSFDLPIENESLNAIIQVFAPGKNEEYARVLGEEGILLTVDPAPMHLFELKSLVYDSPRKHTLPSSEREGFSLLTTKNIQLTISFDAPEQALALIKMTPFYWKLPKDSIDQMCQSLTQVTADFHLQVWKKTP